MKVFNFFAIFFCMMQSMNALPRRGSDDHLMNSTSHEHHNETHHLFHIHLNKNKTRGRGRNSKHHSEIGDDN